VFVLLASVTLFTRQLEPW